MNRFFGCFLLICLSSCTVHQRMQVDSPPVCMTEEFSNQRSGVPLDRLWWQTFGFPDLNRVVDWSLEHNLDLRQAWSRLAQARANIQIANADRYPNITLSGPEIGKNERTIDEVAKTRVRDFRYGVGIDLSYEIDLWKRIDSRVKATQYEEMAVQEDVEGTAQLIAGTATDVWFQIQEQMAQLEILKVQIHLNETLLELVELRFNIGEAAALDVYQQRLRLENTRSQVPPAQSSLEQLRHQLSVIMGIPPTEDPIEGEFVALEDLPPFPDIGVPVNLLDNRPDLRSIQRRLASTDYQVAAAIADLYPKLTFFLGYEFRASQWSQVFRRLVEELTLNLLTPIFDGGRRWGFVEQRRAVFCEQMELFGQLYLLALQEIEDAIVFEKYQLELIEDIKKQIVIAEATIREARERNLFGLVDYLNVITATAALQDLQRSLLFQQRVLFANRAVLYRALGGSCLTYGLFKPTASLCCEDIYVE